MTGCPLVTPLSARSLRGLIALSERADFVIVPIHGSTRGAMPARAQIDDGLAVFAVDDAAILDDDLMGFARLHTDYVLTWRREYRFLTQLDVQRVVRWRSAIGSFPTEPFLPNRVRRELARGPDTPAPEGSPRWIICAAHHAAYRQRVLDSFLAADDS